MNLKFNYYWLFVLPPLIFGVWLLSKTSENKPLRYLPYYGPKNWSKSGDTNYHSIPAFLFTNQNKVTFSSKDVKDKIYVCEYFFSTCKSICPIMNKNLEKVYQLFKNDADFLILSHTVDPETDSSEVLLNYAKMHGVNNQQWQFLTGSKQDLYTLARKGYLLSADEGNGGAEDFIHTQNFALIDKNGHIRGYYDGTDSLEVKRLIIDINVLKQAYAFQNKSNP
jgi:protein SCO1/2